MVRTLTHACRGALVLALAITAGCSGGWRVNRVPEPPKAAKVRASPAHPVRAAEFERRVEARARFTEGVVRDLRDESQAAEQAFQASVAADPAHEQLAVDLAQRHLQNREPARAVAVLQLAATHPGASGWLFGWLGMAHAQTGAKTEAAAAYREAIQRAPQSFLGYHGLAQLHLQNRQTNEALAVLDSAQAVKEPAAAFLVDLATYHVAAGRQRLLATEITKPRVLALLERAARLNPTEPLVLERMADAYKAVGEIQRAIALYDDLLEHHPPESPAARLALRQQLFQFYLGNNDRANAARQLEAIVRDHPTDPRAHVLLGVFASEDKRFAEAERHFEKALVLNPELEPAYYDLAGVQLVLQKPDAAEATVQAARGRFQPGFLAEFYSGLVAAARKQYETARQHFGAAELHAQVADPGRLNDFFYFQLGAAHERTGRYAEAEAAFRKCLELAPENAEALNYLGYMFAERGEKLDEALTLIQRALKLEPDNAAFLDSLAWVLFKLGRAAEALEPMQRAVHLSEKPDATLLDHLGDILATLGRMAEAREAWRSSLAVEPNPAVEKKLEAGGPSAPSR